VLKLVVRKLTARLLKVRHMIKKFLFFYKVMKFITLVKNTSKDNFKRSS